MDLETNTINLTLIFFPALIKKVVEEKKIKKIHHDLGEWTS